MKVWRRWDGPKVSLLCSDDKPLSVIFIRHTSYVVLPMPRKRLRGKAALKQMGRPVRWVSDKY